MVGHLPGNGLLQDKEAFKETDFANPILDLQPPALGENQPLLFNGPVFSPCHGILAGRTVTAMAGTAAAAAAR